MFISFSKIIISAYWYKTMSNVFTMHFYFIFAYTLLVDHGLPI